MPNYYAVSREILVLDISPSSTKMDQSFIREDGQMFTHLDLFICNLRPFQDYFSSYETGQSVGG